MEAIEKLLTNPEQISFAVLFVGLLVYVMKTNDKREQNYRNTIDKLTQALSNFDEVKNKVEEIHKKISSHS
ncbi:BhlA/UviB family holin-like peptide [Carnobacterium divergens]|nr:BhlA/UviB family holin-like peptide [Carnobacterium divergens]MDT1955231.1 BhlA/UviB family holin-like peptide [Carnobacterium divergens]MDT1960469.1 BhlA/UviB family holin-like peptide [Carnobacterium divergens]MDT1963013.1 BhlA/UviB family holin-like peptide [Carnobacterium divergens]